MGKRALFALLAVLLLASPAAAARDVRTTGHDAVTTPGREVALAAKFERDLFGYFAPDIRNEDVRFWVAGVDVGTARTDGDGVAYLRYTPTREGTFGIVAKLTGRKWEKTPATSTLYVLSPAKPTIVSDIDGTLSDMADWQVPFFGHRADAFPNSPEVLRRLAKDYNIIYLTARDDALTPMSRAFLAKHGFPPGALVSNDWGLRTAAERDQIKSSNHGEFKRLILEGLKARGVYLVAGLGNADTDGFAYEAAGIVSYLRTDGGTGARPGSIYHDDYLGVEADIASRTWPAAAPTKGVSGALGGAAGE
jgi:hypothetical protein